MASVAGDLFMRNDALLGRAPPIIILESDNVVLIEIGSALDLYQEGGNLPGIGEAYAFWPTGM